MNYNIYQLIIHDFAFIPIKLRQEKRFCLWKYQKSNSAIAKPLKKPYGLDSINRIIPSLKDRKYWFDLPKLKQLSSQLMQEYGLGLILNDGPYIVIDLDNCVSVENNHFVLLQEAMEIIKLFPDAYCEISPSHRGLHIIFKGEWLANFNKGKKYISKGLKQGTIEIYSGHNCRYVTLTGNSINDTILKKDLPCYSFEDKSLQKLYKDFFSIEYSNNKFHSFIKNPLLKQTCFEFNIDQKILDKQYVLIRQKILHSNLSKIYSDLCILTNPGYLSPSEADWSYFLLILGFLKLDQTYAEKYCLLKFFYQRDRPERSKKNRKDYIKVTLEKILNLVSYENQIVNICNVNEKQIKNNNSIQKVNISKVDKYQVLKICNIMKIFHLGKSVNNFEYINSNNNNYLKATIPVSLNQNDLVNYIEILDQYTNFIFNEKYLPDQYIPINIQKILNNKSKTISGKSYRNFMNTVKKLSHVIIEYDKQINTDGLRSKKVGSLLAYEYKYQNSSGLDDLNSYKKLLVKMHPSILDIVKNSNYNYAVFNKQSFSALENNELKLLYYYFCISTLPGSFSQKFSIDDLLKLWPESQNRQTISKRKHTLCNFLQKFCKNKEKIFDLDIVLQKENQKIIGLKVKKRKLNLV